MNERELRQALKAASDRFEAAKTANNIEEMRAATKEVAEKRELLDMEMSNQANKVPDLDEPKAKAKADRSIAELNDAELEKRYEKTFLKAIRSKSLNAEDQEIFERVQEKRAFSSTVDADGGLIVPEDVQTKINEFKRTFVALEQYVTTERVSMKSGSRVLEANADLVPFADINEWGEIAEIDSPKFSQMTYAIKDYAGILPIPNTLLQDTDQNLMTYVAKWIAKKSVFTRNVKILALLNALTVQALANIDDIKTVFNVALDPSIAVSSQVVTNQDGFNHLDQLKDIDGRYVLQPNPLDATQKLLFGKPVIVLPNKNLPSTVDVTDGTLAPVFLGDLKEAIILFDRGVYEIKTTDIGGKSFTRNTTDMRVIDRFDIKEWDKEAVIAGTLVVVAP